MRQRWRQAPSSSLCILLPQGFGEQSPQVSSFPRLPVLVTGGVHRVLPCGISKPQRPHPEVLPGQPEPPTQPRSAIARVCLKPSTNKRGVSPAAAHSPGKATAAEALTWKFTQTLSGFAIKQQNVTLLLLPLCFTSLQPAWQGHCPPVLAGAGTALSKLFQQTDTEPVSLTELLRVTASKTVATIPPSLALGNMIFLQANFQA